MQHQRAPKVTQASIVERYRMLEKLGDGSFGVVHSAKPNSITCNELMCGITPNTVVRWL